jgi:GNAT superfamily N-acetyltransferase
MTVSTSEASEREAIIAIAHSTAVFSPEEMETVGELFDDYLRDANASGYNFLSYRENGAVQGFACWGPASLSNGAADLYWISTAPAAQGRGVATALFHAIEAAVQAAGRWLIVIWTSSRPEYAAARQFYLRQGCALTAQVPDFYDRGDDLCMYTRRL